MRDTEPTIDQTTTAAVRIETVRRTYQRAVIP